MKKKSVTGLLIVCALLACSCGKKDNIKDIDTVQQSNAPAEEEETPKQEESVSDDTVPDISNSTAIEQETSVAGAMSAEECMEAYMAFLNNEAELYFDGEWTTTEINWMYSPVSVLGGTDEGLTISGMTEKYFKAIEAEYDGVEIKPEYFSYAFIDCGNDAVPELALMIDDLQIGQTMEFSDIFVIKLKEDGKLHLCFWNETGYNEFGTLCEYGEYYSASSFGVLSDFYSLKYINADGEPQLVYTEQDIYSVDGLSLDEDRVDAAYAKLEELGDDVRFMTIFNYSLQKFEEDITPAERNAATLWTYLDDGNYKGDDIEQDPSILEDGSPYKEYWDETGLPLTSYEDICNQIDARKRELGITQEIDEAESVEWQPLSDNQIAGIYSWKPNTVSNSGTVDKEAVELVIDNPGWEYYKCDEEAESGLSIHLIKVSEEGNNIIDDYDWFDGLGLVPFDRNEFSDEKYDYKLATTDNFDPYLLDVFDKNTGKCLVTLNMCRFYYPEQYVQEDVYFIGESIRWAQSKDNVIYVCTTHPTYASSASQNAYITAIELNDTYDDYKVLWRSEPLVANADNFVIFGDYIICGYGFTNEPDFIYVLDRATGVKMDTYPVKTGPDYFYVDGNDLYVRTYDTNYHYEIKED